MKPILFFGEALIDCQCDEWGHIRQALPGGAPLNAAVGSARLGLPAAFAGAVGNDAYSRLLEAILQQEGINAKWLKIVPNTVAPRAIVTLNQDKVPSFKFDWAQSAPTLLTRDFFAALDVTEYSMFHCGGVMLTSDNCAKVQQWLMQRFIEKNIPISFDPNIRPALISKDREETCRRRCLTTIRSVDVLKLSDDDLEWLFPQAGQEAALKSLLQLRGSKLTGITMGRSGSLLVSGENAVRVPCQRVLTIDTTGCGDGYMAGLMAALFSGQVQTKWDQIDIAALKKIGRQASGVAGFVAAHQGTIPAMPHKNELNTGD